MNDASGPLEDTYSVFYDPHFSVFSLFAVKYILRMQTTLPSRLLSHEQLHMFVSLAHLSVK